MGRSAKQRKRKAEERYCREVFRLHWQIQAAKPASERKATRLRRRQRFARITAKRLARERAA